MFRSVLCVFFALAALGTSAVNAAIILQFDMDTTVSGIQSTRAAAPLEEFDIDVIFMLTSAPPPNFIFPTFSLNMTYDTNHVEVLSAIATTDQPGGPRPTGYDQNSTLTFGSGIVGPFDGTGTSLMSAPQNFSLGRVTLRTLNSTPVTTMTQLLGFTFGTGLASATSIAGTTTLTVTAIPEPSIALLGMVSAISVRLARTRARRVRAVC